MTKLRLIIIILALQAVVFASIGAFLFFSSYQRAAVHKAEQQTLTKALMVKRNLNAFLTQHIKPVRTLSRLEELRRALLRPDTRTLQQANAILDIFQASLDVDACYLMDPSGRTIATSNRRDPDSFLHQNFAFRPYFQQAMRKQPMTYLALGTTSHKRGAYSSHPVYGSRSSSPLGVVVIKASIEYIESELLNTAEQIFLVTDPNGVVFITNKKEWLYRTTKQLTPAIRRELRASKQFGQGPWPWTGLQFHGREVRGTGGTTYAALTQDIESFPGWQLIFLHNQDKISGLFQAPLLRISSVFILIFCCLIALSVYLLYRRAGQELNTRTRMEAELRKSEDKYRSIYHNTPAMLHSIDAEYTLISVSDYWLEATGYEREEVIGKKLTDFFCQASKELAEQTFLPSFFKTGKNQNIPYQLLKKDGTIMDISLSCIGIQDEQGRIVRSLAISVDVTDRNRAQQELKEAKEALSAYSKNLEQIVRERTRELKKLSSDIISSQEKERAAISRELHDELGQMLTALRMDSVWLEKQLRDCFPEAAERAAVLGQNIDKALDDVRTMSFQLRPGVLDDLGLVDALESLALYYEKRVDMSFVFEHDDLYHLEATASTAVYRIVQEALTNAVRHSRASQVEIRLFAENSTLCVEVTDDGQGFAPGESQNAGFGIAGMQERADLVRGQFRIDSAPNQGTRIFCTLPLET